ncbi:MAG: hypothetical protein KF889_27835 [Alphaproteobacteria bacterium]|nr:hypothetical protein [Alphaproteobacteria bacterium]MCW5743767.1 hypothetical protein [Alphaproteobacteria bacterium]
MAGRIKIEPYKPLDTSTSPVPGGGYIDVDASVGKFGPSPLTQFGLQAAEGVAAIATTAAHHLAPDNEAVVKAADTRLSETEQALLFDPRTGHLNRQGQDALTQAPAVLEAYRAAQDRELAATANDDQHHMLRQLNERRLASFSTVVEQHGATERQRWHDAAGERRIALMQADAALHWSDDALLRRALGTVRAEVREKAERHVWDSALTEAALSRETSRTLASAIEAAVERDPERAQSLRMRYDQHIEAPDRAALDALLAEAQTRQRAQRASAEILNSTPPDGQAPTLTWQLQQADAIAEPAVRAAAVRSLHAAAAAAEARARAQAEQVLARVLKDGLTDPSQIPLRDWVALDPERRQAIETRLDHNAAGTEPAANPALVDELATQMTEAPSVFARRDLVLSIAHHPLPQWQRFRDLQAGLRRNDPATEDEIHAIKRGLQLANKMLPVDTPDDVATNYRAELVDEIDTWRRINGKHPDDDTIREMLQRTLPSTAAVHAIKFPFNPQLDSPIHPARLPVPRRMERQAIDLLQLLWLLWRGIAIGLKVDQDSTPPTRSTTPTLPPPADGRSSDKATPAPNVSEVERSPEPGNSFVLAPRITPAPPVKPLPGFSPAPHVPPLPGIIPLPQEPSILKGPELDPPQLPSRLENIPQIEPGPLIVTSDNLSEALRIYGRERWELHHHFPRQWWKPNGPDSIPFGPGAKKFFDKQLILIPKSQHWGTLHSKYNEAVGEALKIYLAGKSQADIENMDEIEAKKCFDEVIEMVRERGSAEAKEFLKNIGRFEPKNDNTPRIQ